MVGEIERVLAALERANVRYLVVGGVAVVPREDLSALEREAGRPLDLEDVERLRELGDDDG